MARYCCRDCQVSHWPRHKEACKKRAAELFDKELFKDPPEREECPICMLPFPYGEGQILFACCGNILCMGCLRAQFKEDVNNGKEFEDCRACPFCRTPNTQDKKEQNRWLNRSVERNHAPSMYKLAAHYMRGSGGLEKDMTKAIELFEKSGKLGDAESYGCLGDIYCDGEDGVDINIKKARYYYELGAIGGSTRARLNLAHLDLNGGNFKRGFKHALICAKAGMTKSLETLKFGCKKGYITKDEYAEALRAHQKQHKATRSEMRDEVSGLDNIALEWERYYYEIKAAKGDVSSLYDLACLEWDVGNYALACKKFLLCAKAGIKPALKRLKIGVGKGFVPENDYEEALRAYDAQHKETRSALRNEAPVVNRSTGGNSKGSIQK